MSYIGSPIRQQQPGAFRSSFGSQNVEPGAARRYDPLLVFVRAGAARSWTGSARSYQELPRAARVVRSSPRTWPESGPKVAPAANFSRSQELG